jgi:hypothetical protein
VAKHTADEQRNIDTVNAMFEAGPELDRATLFANDAVWWNGLPLIPGNVGQTEHGGIDAITNILRGSGQCRSVTVDGAAPTFPQSYRGDLANFGVDHPANAASKLKEVRRS